MEWFWSDLHIDHLSKMPIDLLFSTPNFFLNDHPSCRCLRESSELLRQVESWSSTQLQLSCSTYNISLWSEGIWRELMRHKVATTRRSRKVRVQNSCASFVMDVTVCPHKAVMAVMLAAFPLCVEKLGRRQLSVWLCGWERVQEAMDAWEKGRGVGRVCILWWRCATKVTPIIPEL